MATSWTFRVDEGLLAAARGVAEARGVSLASLVKGFLVELVAEPVVGPAAAPVEPLEGVSLDGRLLEALRKAVDEPVHRHRRVQTGIRVVRQGAFNRQEVIYGCVDCGKELS